MLGIVVVVVWRALPGVKFCGVGTLTRTASTRDGFSDICPLSPIAMLTSVVGDLGARAILVNGVRPPFAPLIATSMLFPAMERTVIVSPAFNVRREMRDPAERLMRALFCWGDCTMVASLRTVSNGRDELFVRITS